MAAVMAVLIDGGRFILGRSAKQNAIQGKWITPAGKVEEGESLEEAVRREVREETGLDIPEFRKVCEVEGEIVPLMHVFEADVTGCKIDFDRREFSEVGAFTREEALRLQLGKATKQVLEERYA
jgi:8-oxo-dGTP pyrophosphatase MutT (NUDIX family)